MASTLFDDLENVFLFYIFFFCFNCDEKYGLVQEKLRCVLAMIACSGLPIERAFSIEWNGLDERGKHIWGWRTPMLSQSLVPWAIEGR
jgi:hypothetical protein